MKRFVPFIIALILMVGASAYGHRPVQNPDPNHIHVDFAVWVNGKQLDFSDQKYMSEAYDPDSGQEVRVDPMRKFLHLHDGNSHIVHRHKPGLGFGEFLASIGFTLTDTCLTTDDAKQFCTDSGETLQLFVNGTQVSPFVSNYVFHDNDQILLTYGADTPEVQHELSLMTHDACLYSKTCPWRGAPPTENCIADPTVPCVAP